MQPFFKKRSTTLIDKLLIALWFGFTETSSYSLSQISCSHLLLVSKWCGYTKRFTSFQVATPFKFPVCFGVGGKEGRASFLFFFFFGHLFIFFAKKVQCKKLFWRKGGEMAGAGGGGGILRTRVVRVTWAYVLTFSWKGGWETGMRVGRKGLGYCSLRILCTAVLLCSV